jgi:predicted nucleic acid-binding protein
MGPLNIDGLPDQSLLLIDTAPIVYVLEKHPSLAARFEPLFEAHMAGRFRFAVTTVTIAEVLTGPLQRGEEGLARRYRAALQSWQVVGLDADIAESVARLRASARLKLPDAVQAATALAINADGLVTYDRDFARVRGLNVIS